MIFDATLKPILHIEECIKENSLDVPLPDGITLEPMTLRFDSISNGIVSCWPVVGPANRPTPSTYKGEDMWVAIAPLVPYLRELTAYAGDVLHLAAICHPDGKTTKRYPIALVETVDLSATDASNFSRGNLRSASVQIGHRMFSFSQERYLSFIKERNGKWRHKNRVTFKEARTKLDVINEIEALLVELRSFR